MSEPWRAASTPCITTEPNANPTAVPTLHQVCIHGPNLEEERLPDAVLPTPYASPGPGILPPMLFNIFHDPYHTLYNISLTGSQLAASTPHAPLLSETLEAIPHPHAYFCKEHNGWV